MPAFVDALTSLSSKLLGKLLGVEAMLASRSLASFLAPNFRSGWRAFDRHRDDDRGRIMVGSFRQTS